MGDVWLDHKMQQLGKRGTSRLRVRLLAKLITTRETLGAELRDLSYFGARLDCRTPPQPGKEVVVQWDRFDAFGMVVWSNHDCCGVRFFDPVGPEVLIATRDLDDVEHIHSSNELSRREAKDFVNGNIRR
ncbi:PilZ domain-containing protein [Novosphingobium sp. TH158]|uniref:PilZ domain-containing protein n=1 Tax=Novosphingobium sp. TH158 TaxID=2067455 RepID=UPI000C7CE1D2|nr:PilZ domain-containing protein [Novosphingobium sp. TH158]PLK26006.1 PilZ domain-containing protein [Novosphingobium sp. TH158]